MTRPGAAQTPVAATERLVVDLDGEVSIFDPAETYTTRGWSIVHSIYDALVDFGPDGSVVPLAAETFTTEDAVTFAVKLREGMTFHDGSPAPRRRSPADRHMKASESQVADDLGRRPGRGDRRAAGQYRLFRACRVAASRAVWQVLLPEVRRRSRFRKPVGSGPYRWEAFGRVIASCCGATRRTLGLTQAGARRRAVYRFVPSRRRRPDLATGQADLIVGSRASEPGCRAGGEVIVPRRWRLRSWIATDVARSMIPACDRRSTSPLMFKRSHRRWRPRRVTGWRRSTPTPGRVRRGLSPFAFDPMAPGPCWPRLAMATGSAQIEVSQAPRSMPRRSSCT